MPASLELAKPAIDVGLMTNALAPNRAMLAELGLRFDHLLKVGGGVHQYRYACGRSVVKLNSCRARLAPGPTGYSALRLASDVDAPRELRSPDGIRVLAVPRGHEGVVGVEVTWRTADPAAAERFLVGGLGATAHGSRFRIGESWLVIEHDPQQPHTGGRDAPGLRYLTVQVRDLEAEHRRILGLGFEQGAAPVRLGDTAYISFVRDADGNWIELSQRASLTGPLPDVPPERHRKAPLEPSTG